MDRNQIEELTSNIRKETNTMSAPVNLLNIAKAEEILLAPGCYGEEFNGRIEFHHKKRRFILFHPEIGTNYSSSRIRFSIAHELGHYYMPKHRKLLTRGCSHYSKSGFISENKLEREADFFAASLLLPGDVLTAFCRRKKFFTLKEITELANEWQTSVISAAIRYVQWTSECCAMVLSKDSQVCYYIPSEDAEYRGFKWLGIKKVAPQSTTIKADSQQGSGQFFEQESHTEFWFSNRRANAKLWEEAFPLGYTGLVLTMLTFEVEDIDD